VKSEGLGLQKSTKERAIPPRTVHCRHNPQRSTAYHCTPLRHELTSQLATCSGVNEEKRKQNLKPPAEVL